MNYYEHHLGDYAEATAHLSFAEDAAYSRLLRKIYSTEKPLPEKKAAIYRLVGADRKTDQRAVDVVLVEFFELREDGWHNARADREIARFQDKQRKAKASADARWANTERNANASGKDMRTHSEGNAPRARSSPQSPDTSHQEEISNLPVAPARPLAEPAGLVLVGDPPKAPPDCAHLEVLALWHEVLPALPQHLPEQWRGTRADHLRARWRETAALKRWTEKQHGLDYFRRLFAYVGQSAFLTGRARQTDPNKRPFVVELEWLVNPTNWAKVHEGKYHPEQAA